MFGVKQNAKSIVAVLSCNYYALTELDKPALSDVVFERKTGAVFVFSFRVSFLFQVRQAVAEGNCCFGTIDTWLLFKLTKGVFGM